MTSIPKYFVGDQEFEDGYGLEIYKSLLGEYFVGDQQFEDGYGLEIYKNLSGEYFAEPYRCLDQLDFAAEDISKEELVAVIGQEAYEEAVEMITGCKAEEIEV